MKGVAGAATIILYMVIGSGTADSGSDVPGSRAVPSLKFVFVICRHGNRGAYKDYAQDPYPLNDPKYFPYGKGGLTPNGRVRMYKLGIKVRGLYNGFLNSTFDPAEIYASSTASERTLMSGQSFLTGLYPPRGFQVWDKDILWQPVPLYSTSPDNAHRTMKCQKFLMQFDELKKKFYKDQFSPVSEVMNHYNEATGSNATNRFVWYIWDKLASESTEGYALPEWTKRIYPDPLKDIMTKQYIMYYADNDSVVRIITGNLVEEIMLTVKNKMDGKLRSRRMQFYSGHDSSLVPLMIALGVPRPEVPLVRPSSALLLELHQDPTTSKHFAKTLYIDGGSDELELRPISLQSCEEPYDVDCLLNHTSWLSGFDYDQYCHVAGFNTSFLNLWSE